MIDCVVNCKHLKIKKIYNNYTNLGADLSVRFEAEEYYFNKLSP